MSFFNIFLVTLHYLIILFQLTLLFPSSIGSISGTIVDSDTHQPLPGANIILIDTDLGIATDINGKFSLNNIPVGSYSVSVSMIGYESQSRANINIYSDRQTPINFYLSLTNRSFQSRSRCPFAFQLALNCGFAYSSAAPSRPQRGFTARGVGPESCGHDRR